MGLSYNPSSFATNKTILEAIEELKRYLMANPLACIYELSGNADPNVLTYSLTSVIVPDGQELKDGDILLSDNGYYAFIDEVGENDVTVLQWTLVGSHITSMTLTSSVVSVENTPTYLTGWIYRANAWTSDRYRILSYDLTLTYEDESMFPSTQVQSFTLPLQSINAIWYYLESDNSTTIYVDVNKDDGTNEVNSFSIPAGVPGQDGADGNDGVSITGATIDASNHLILTLSDGNTIDAGALPTPNEYTHTVAITTTSGTFSDADFAKLGYGDSTIVYTDAYSISTVYKLKLETASILEFEAIDAASRNNLKLIDVNKTTKAYSMTAISMITSSTISSGTATSGKVLTANGTGGTSWETVSGGGIEAISLTEGTSGTLSQADYDKINTNGAIIIGTNRIFHKYNESSTEIIFESFYQHTDGIRRATFTITKSTRAYAYSWSYFKGGYNNVNSQTATNGQVLTADGSGNASWQTPSGGSLYQHNIMLEAEDGTNNHTHISCIIINNSNTQFTLTTLNNYLNNNGFTSNDRYPANGVFSSQYTPSVKIVVGLVGQTSNIGCVFSNAGTPSALNTNSFQATGTITDKVIAI